MAKDNKSRLQFNFSEKAFRKFEEIVQKIEARDWAEAERKIIAAYALLVEKAEDSEALSVSPEELKKLLQIERIGQFEFSEKGKNFQKQFDFSQESFEKMKELSEKTGAITLIEIQNRALAVYYFLLKRVENNLSLVMDSEELKAMIGVM